MHEENPYRKILRSTTTIGGASVTNTLLGLVRVKAIAALLGPSGIGVFGLLTTIMTTAATLAGFGLASSGVRQLAASSDSPQDLTRVRHALSTASVLLGLLGGGILILVRKPVSQWIFGDVGHGDDVGWLGFGVLLTLIAAGQTALLQGLRRIGFLARASILGALLASIGGVLVVWHFGMPGVVFCIILGPAMSVVATSVYVARLPRLPIAKDSLQRLWSEWGVMLSIGAVFMITTLLSGATQLVVRAMLVRGNSLEDAGYFQAAWVISTQYIGFVLAAMSAEYYPRLVQISGDRTNVNVMVNQQIEVALLLSGSVMLATMALAPWAIDLLYSRDFYPSVKVLRWQVMGDVLKVAGWPMGFILIARAERTWFLLTQTLWNVSYMALVWLGLPLFGLEITGAAFFICYAIGFMTNLAVLGRIAGFVYSASNLKLLVRLILGASATFMLSGFDESYGGFTGALLAAIFGAYSARRLLRLGAVDVRLPSVIAKLRMRMSRTKER